MDSDQWRRIEHVLDTVLEHDSQEWPEVVARACGADEALRRSVEDLLSRYASAQRFLMKPPAAAAAALLSEQHTLDASDRFEGRRIGAYRLVREIGGGGMARVFLAERADGQFRQEVALKLLRPGLDADIEQRRFLAERQILASLHHPNIARLLDGGLTDEGLPYLALEYIEGQPIDAYCDEQKLPVRDRLELFLGVTEATQYAHRNLIVHRDLKPSNILVTSDGEVKLLDFGIAKLLGTDGQQLPVATTRPGRRWMTPQYASPEQIRGDPVTTATDVYQLGVLLYQLLCGRLPFELEGSRIHDFERTVLQNEPRAPSTTLPRRRKNNGEGEALSANQASLERHTRPNQLRKILRGDLDAIALKALRSEPDQRYASVHELADDIRRYLSGHAVLARGQARTYRISRFARRHRWALAAASAFLVLLSAYAATVTAQASRIRRALDQVTIEAHKAEQVTEFMLGLFEANDPAEARGDTITARELLDRGVARTRWLDGQPVLQAQMLDLVGRIRTDLGAYAQAEPVLEQALATRRRTLGSQHPDVAESLHHLANLAHLSGDHPRAVSLHREALVVRRESFGDGHPKTLESLFALATATHEGGDYAAGKTLLEEWIAAQSSRPAEMSADYADQLEALGTLLTYSADPDDLDRAEPLLQRALAIRKSIYGPTHPQVAISLDDLGTLLARKGDPKTAEQLIRESLEIRRAIYPADHREIAQGLIGLYASLEDLGRLDEAADVLREALSIQLTRGKDHPDAVNMKRMLGRVLTKNGEYEEAESLLRDAVREHAELFGEDHSLTVRARFYLGDALRAQGAFDEAEPLLVDACDYYLKAQGTRSRRTRTVAESLASLYEATGRPAEAAKYRALRAHE